MIRLFPLHAAGLTGQRSIEGVGAERHFYSDLSTDAHKRLTI
jgi:hypothetical protein